MLKKLNYKLYNLPIKKRNNNQSFDKYISTDYNFIYKVLLYEY